MQVFINFAKQQQEAAEEEESADVRARPRPMTSEFRSRHQPMASEMRSGHEPMASEQEALLEASDDEGHVVSSWLGRRRGDQVLALNYVDPYELELSQYLFKYQIIFVSNICSVI